MAYCYIYYIIYFLFILVFHYPRGHDSVSELVGIRIILFFLPIHHVIFDLDIQKNDRFYS